MDETCSSPSMPVPQPRVRPTGKTPVPLPRTVVGVDIDKSPSAGSSKEDVDPNRNEIQPIQHSYSLTRVAKSQLRRVKSNVQEKGSAVLETTKSVGNKLETSVRNMLSKRMTTLGIPDDRNKGDDTLDNFLTSQSLPADDLFNSISFGSPLASEVIYAPIEGEDCFASFPPPSYPPPPLPDESIYDELVSARSGSSLQSIPAASKTGRDLPPKNCSYYEELPVLKRLSIGSPWEDQSDISSVSGAISLPQPRHERSDSCESWKFYDVVHGVNRTKVPGPCYENVAVEDNYVEMTENIYSREPTRIEVVDKGECSKSNCLVPSKASGETSDSSDSHMTNELYENWKLSEEEQNRSEQPPPPPKLKPTKSVIYEFDPLFEQKLRLKRETLIEEEASEFDVNSIPPPPERIDSLPDSDSPTRSVSPSNEYLMYHRVAIDNPAFNDNDESQKDLPLSMPKEGRKLSSLVRWTSMKRAIKTLKDGTSWSPGSNRKDNLIKGIVYPVHIQNPHSGFLVKSPSNGEKPKDFVARWCLLSEGKLLLAPDKNASSKEIIPLENILSIRNVTIPKSSSTDGESVHSWEISVTGRGKPHVLGSTSLGDAKMWMRKLLESLTNVFPSTLSADFSRAGQCFLKEGVTQEWGGAWILLKSRILHYCVVSEKPKEIDLRKVRLTVLSSDSAACTAVSELGPFIQVHTVDTVVYLQMDQENETRTWYNAIRLATMDCGPSLNDQQLNKFNIPVLVDKCINFIYAHGSMSEGIYRRSGSNTSVTKLMSLLRADAWSAQLSRNEYSEHDVSSVLKRFFRELPEPLFSTTLHKYFCCAANSKCSTSEKIVMYRRLVDRLPSVNYVTARRLIGHLHFVAEQSEKNKMPVENLAAIWAPTLMSVEGKRNLEWSKKECDVISDLISHYKSVFLVDCEEVDREKRILEVLERVSLSPNLPPPKPSGDLQIAVYIGAKSKESVSVMVKPNMNAGELCSQLSSKTEFDIHELCLTEMVLGGALSRPLHHSEKVLEVALRWAYWDSNDCKDNYFLLGPNTVYREILPLAKPPISKCGELKFADHKMKSFKNFVFEFTQAKLSYYKDKACSIKLSEWKIEDIVWYIGHEPKRNPSTRWSITFIRRNEPVKRTKESPYFGWTIAGVSRDDQLHWIAAMLLGEYNHGDLLLKPSLL